MEKIKYHFFWGGIYSNWHKAPMTVNINGTDMLFNCGEQYMMYCKASLMNDKESLKEVMKTSDPRQQKKIGRNIKNFNSELWDKNKFAVMMIGLTEKFRQNPDLKKQLLEEDCDIFVEASPYDRIWGIGYLAQDAEDFVSDWGENLLGKIITLIRFKLQAEEENNSTIKNE